MENRHKEFAESLRRILRDEETSGKAKANHKARHKKETEESIDYTSLEEELSRRFDELFGTSDENDD